MDMQPLSSSNITFGNQTEVIDLFCIDLPVGPLLWVVFSVLCALVGLPTSVWLLWVLVQRQRSGISIDIYMLNLTAIDLIFNVCIVPMAFNYLFLRNDFIFSLRHITYVLNNSGRPLLMAFICVDCYMAVVFPIVYKKMKNSKHRMVACVLAWGLTLLYGMMFVLNVQNLSFTISYVVISYVFTLVTIIFCDLSMLYSLRKPDPSGRTYVHPQKQRALHTITNSFIMNLIAYLPPLVVLQVICENSLTQQENWCNLLIPSFIFPTLGSTIMPLLHLGNLGSFKNLGGFQCCKF